MLRIGSFRNSTTVVEWSAIRLGRRNDAEQPPIQRYLDQLCSNACCFLHMSKAGTTLSLKMFEEDDPQKLRKIARPASLGNGISFDGLTHGTWSPQISLVSARRRPGCRYMSRNNSTKLAICNIHLHILTLPTKPRGRHQTLICCPHDDPCPSKRKKCVDQRLPSVPRHDPPRSLGVGTIVGHLPS